MTPASLTRLAAAGSLAVGIALGVVFVRTGSQLAFANAADSVLDVATALVLAWSVSVAAQPRDPGHPFGHSRAEPIGALLTAFLAGVLALEVARGAIGSLLGEHTVAPSTFALSVFVAKATFKAALLMLARGVQGPAADALRVDARNDFLVSLATAAGFVGASHGWPDLDAWLALPIAAWIGASGLSLARHNVRLLMGASPPGERLSTIRERAEAIPGVRAVHDLRCQSLGTKLQVTLHIVVDDTLGVRDAHDIGVAVRHAIEADGDVEHAEIHIDVDAAPEP